MGIVATVAGCCQYDHSYVTYSVWCIKNQWKDKWMFIWVDKKFIFSMDFKVHNLWFYCRFILMELLFSILFVNSVHIHVFKTLHTKILYHSLYICLRTDHTQSNCSRFQCNLSPYSYFSSINSRLLFANIEVTPNE